MIAELCWGNSSANLQFTKNLFWKLIMVASDKVAHKIKLSSVVSLEGWEGSNNNSLLINYVLENAHSHIGNNFLTSSSSMRLLHASFRLSLSLPWCLVSPPLSGKSTYFWSPSLPVLPSVTFSRSILTSPQLKHVNLKWSRGWKRALDKEQGECMEVNERNGWSDGGGTEVQGWMNGSRYGCSRDVISRELADL